MQTNNQKKIIQARVIELEEKLMDLIEISDRYSDIPIPIFETEMDEILKEIDYLNKLNNKLLQS